MSGEVKTETVGFYLDSSFALLPVSGISIVLQLANDVTCQKLYDWTTIGPRRGKVLSGTKLCLHAERALDDVDSIDRLIISSETDSRFDDRKVLNWIRKLERHGAHVGSVATGTWILAKAGLLDRRRCTINPTHRETFRAVYPHHKLTNNLFDVEGRIFTCAGGTAAIDMALGFVALSHGMALATEVAGFILHGRIRPHTPETDLHSQDIGMLRPEIQRAISAMEMTIETPLTIENLAREVGTSQRHLLRLFHEVFGQSPASRYRSIRLEKAKRLLRQTNLPISEIGFSCGYNSLSRFCSAFRESFGHSPRQFRQGSE